MTGRGGGDYARSSRAASDSAPAAGREVDRCSGEDIISTLWHAEPYVKRIMAVCGEESMGFHESPLGRMQAWRGADYACLMATP